MITVQRVDKTTYVRPSTKKGIEPYELGIATNCGSNAKKKRMILGLSTLVKTP